MTIEGLIKELRTSRKIASDDDHSLWQVVLSSAESEIRDESAAKSKLPIFLQIGICSHWQRPHQTRWTAAGGFAWPAGYAKNSGFASETLPKFDWSVLYKYENSGLSPVDKFNAKKRFVLKIVVPARTARHKQAVIRTLWEPGRPLMPKGKHETFRGFRNKDGEWHLAAFEEFVAT